MAILPATTLERSWFVPAFPTISSFEQVFRPISLQKRPVSGKRARTIFFLKRAALEEAPDLARVVGRIRDALVREGALLASLSGSGSSYFGLFDDPQRARRAHAALQSQGFAVHRCRTLSLDQYRNAWTHALGYD